MTESKDNEPRFDRALAELLCDLEVPGNIRISPNGEKILYSTALDGGIRKGKTTVSTLWLASAATAGSARQLTSGLFEDREPAWHPDGNQIVFLSDRAKPDESWAVWILRLDGGDPWAVTPVENERTIEMLTVSPDGEYVAYISSDEKSKEQKEQEENKENRAKVWGEDWELARLRLVNLRSKELTTVTCGDRHVVDAAWSPDGKSMVFMSALNDDIEEPMLTGTTISTISIGDDKARDLCTVPNEPWDIKWASDGNIYFVSGTPVDSSLGGSALYVVDPRSGSPAFTRVAKSGDTADCLRLAGGRLLLSHQKRFSTVIEEAGKDVLFSKETDIAAWDVFFDGSSSPTVAVSVSDINNPYEVYSVKEDSLIKLSNHGEAFRDRSFGSCNVLTCPSSDGEVELDSLYLAPATKTKQGGAPSIPLPTVVIIHGGPTSRDTNAFDTTYGSWAQYILSRGYGVLMPQYRGSCGRGEKFAMYSRGGQGVYDYADVVSVTDHAVSKGYADPTRLMVGGWSQGGFLTYLSSVRNGLHGLGWRFNAGIAGAGVCDNESLCMSADLGSTFEAELNGGKIAWTMDRNDATNRQASALWEMASAVNEGRRRGQPVIPPLLILHGQNDVRCPFSQAEGFRRGLRAHGLPCELVCYAEQGHTIKERKLWLDMLERVGRWCDKYIGPDVEDKLLTVNANS